MARISKTRQQATDQLLDTLGSRKVKLEGNAKYMASFDSLKLAFAYDALVLAQSEKDVGTTLKLANEFGVPVTTRGAGTSLTGSAAPAKGGWVLDVSKMNRIKIEKTKSMAIVGPGAVVGQIQAAAEELGLFYPPDPSSLKYSTIGGNIACNAGGMRCAKYGVTRDFVLALEGFLPTGEKVSWGGEYKKFATGYNIRDLWIGSEGTLGVVTKAVLRLLPKPEKKWTILVAFDSDILALEAVQKLLGEGQNPSILEFLDSNSVFCAEEIAGVKLFKGLSLKPLLLVEFDGNASQLRTDKKRAIEWANENGLAYREAKTEKETEVLWSARRACSPAMFSMGDSKINEDIVVPLESQAKFARFLKQMQKKWKINAPTFGHAADGNFHVNIMYTRSDKEECERAKGAVSDLMSKVCELGGTISGEHGIGLAKTPFMTVARNEAEMGAMKAIKNALDPKGILNPGKIFQPYEVWDKTLEKVKLPWDKKPIAKRDS
ncbi:FAD-linked oxidase C-terminal domain-containing protein [Pelagicoccus sp. SDUM812002]|uniref:FAD-binding oxidoreductase n=1 Tax=Pelagicoccus sp. SDUM812002 TaxID=3041266 RepID=UPI00280E1476|nr:FAD-linked oxidase C-terminal domain-containing protein [Pelagicoccus sp. SDUM812002]MDQ8184552.1 FAD-linked oxidase C-terminal domain-containing protein [Pelagicoccus sp. SDUM812002]